MRVGLYGIILHFTKQILAPSSPTTTHSAKVALPWNTFNNEGSVAVLQYGLDLVATFNGEIGVFGEYKWSLAMCSCNLCTHSLFDEDGDLSMLDCCGYTVYRGLDEPAVLERKSHNRCPHAAEVFMAEECLCIGRVPRCQSCGLKHLSEARKLKENIEHFEELIQFAEWPNEIKPQHPLLDTPWTEDKSRSISRTSSCSSLISGVTYGQWKCRMNRVVTSDGPFKPLDQRVLVVDKVAVPMFEYGVYVAHSATGKKLLRSLKLAAVLPKHEFPIHWDPRGRAYYRRMNSQRGQQVWREKIRTDAFWKISAAAWNRR